MEYTRLVKVPLPASLVARMDAKILASPAYQGRHDFIADALENLLADLEVQPELPLESSTATGQLAASQPARSAPELVRTGAVIRNGSAPVRTGASTRRPALDPVMAATMANVLPVEASAPTAPRTSPLSLVPTWGMHNRDFPTLWAAALLGKATAGEGGSVKLREWVQRTTGLAWQLTGALDRQAFDTAGFPANIEKPERTEGRFVQFFLGSEVGKGPLFDLGLATVVGPGSALLTESGLATVRQLEGLSCRKGRKLQPEWRHAWLAHLATEAPADFDLLSRVVSAIADGVNDRTGLVQAVKQQYPAWSEVTANTNVAGFIARGREWGIVAADLVERRFYALVSDAHDALAAAARAKRAPAVTAPPTVSANIARQLEESH